MRDERLTRLWLNNKVMFAKPPENADLLPFNLFVLHQNRECRGKGKVRLSGSFRSVQVSLPGWANAPRRLIFLTLHRTSSRRPCCQSG
jgi:hypothetical protein